ncbi:hypothetical protein V6N13_050158 [Hibiscus sabdariffa]|uniref:Transcriptional coactivator Hfi1/Transcriptional adapter 1 n=1 Tax=Hibiscus sabdariffa TaxID=183260 RepID=A0ABR2QUY0_9ROSI
MVNQNHARIDTFELRSLIVRKLGPQRAEKYFDQLRKLFSLKIDKSKFDKSCFKVIGRENIPLHNRLIRSIIKNACVSKVPPSKMIQKVGSNLQVGNGYQRNCLQSLYGDAFPPSPRKGRSPVNRDRKFRDRPSPLGPLGKTQSVVWEESVSKAQEQSATELLSLGSRPPDVASIEDGEEVEQVAGSPGVQSRSPVTAPLGISINFGGARKALPNAFSYNNYHLETCQTKGDLPDTRSLRSRLQKKLETEGISVSVDCVNLLNNGLDAFMKRLLEAPVRLAGGLRFQRLPPNYLQQSERSFYVSVPDFRTAMELNPQVLGEDWPMQLEKISLSSMQD